MTKVDPTSGTTSTTTSSSSNNKKGKRRHTKKADREDKLQHHSRKTASASSLPPIHLLLGSILSIAIAALLSWYYHQQQQAEYGFLNGPADSKTTLSQLFRIGCDKKTKLVHCNDYLLELYDENRTIHSKHQHSSGSGLQKGWKLLDIPRGVQIWTIDALRDPTIQDIMLRNSQPLSPRAYLALYLAVLRKRTHSLDSRYMSSRERFLKAFLNYMPSYEEYAEFHPILKYYQRSNNNATTTTTSSSTFYADYLIHQLQTQIETEYQAFCDATQSDSGQVIQIQNKYDTVRFIDWREYVTARLQVQTRSLTAGPLSTHDVTPNELAVFAQHVLPETVVATAAAKSPLKDDTTIIRQALTSAMVPLLDALDHHSSPNVGWKYLEGNSNSNSNAGFGENTISTSNTSSFAVFAADDLEGGVALYGNYGMTMPDSRIFAQYGFVNRDGSGRRAALITPFHQILGAPGKKDDIPEEELLQQEKDLKRYLEAGETMSGTNTRDSSRQQEFRDVKLQLLKMFANHQSKWVVSTPGPSDRKREGDEDDTSNGDVGWNEVLSTCRLIVLELEDYDGKGMEAVRLILQSIENGSLELSAFQVRPGSASLEQRARAMMAYLANETFQILVSEEPKLEHIETEASLAYTLLGELDVLRLLIAQFDKKSEGNNCKTDNCNHLSDESCSSCNIQAVVSQPKSIPPVRVSLHNEELDLARQQLLATPSFMPNATTLALKDEHKEDSTTASSEHRQRPNFITTPLPNDVLFGRGRPLQAHHGNLRFHRIVNRFREAYKNARKDDKATVTATVIAEISTPDPLPTPPTTVADNGTVQTINEDGPNQQKPQHDSTKQVDDTSFLPSGTSPSGPPAPSVNDHRKLGGRFLKRTDDGKYWIEVSTAEAMEKASHALRGLPRRTELGQSSTNSRSSSPTASPVSSTTTTTKRQRDGPDSAIRSHSRKKKKRPSKSSQQEELNNPTAAAAASINPQVSNPCGGNLLRDDAETIRRAMDALAGVAASFPPPLGAVAATTPEQLALALVQQQQAQRQLELRLVDEVQQRQQQERQMIIDRARQEIHRQVVVEMMAQQIVQQEQEQLHAQQLLQDQAIRQLLQERQQQHQQALSSPQLLPFLSPQSTSNGLFASLLQGDSGATQRQQVSLLHPPQIAQQQSNISQGSLSQQLLLLLRAGTNLPRSNEDAAGFSNLHHNSKPHAR
ncbi:hypothetical protein IV203_012807 [Nitzschia inconspicua]|uniref:DUF6824 domain-containing protein n=1 Tax=Nitzschia inconspicua TaxID=303405 RepID=A0A9K3M482_9STRA|nr:hypothetical protein IV203_012807 [Nitzschia inconspicua]